MKLLSLQYTNIGPFQDQTVIVRPKHGSYIIKAPIGSGKSVLFFDGPLFALYNKKNTRPLLNMNSQQGEVVIEFEHLGVQYCVQRILSKTKAGNSVKSKMWQKILSGQPVNEQNPIIEFLPVTAFVLPGGYEAVEFKNETDLQKLIDDLLPRKEVLLGTYFLMQDSTNIFELPPQERLMILKNIFDLLGIDETKEKISEQKREISALIKARSDDSLYDNKLQQGIHALMVSWNDIDRLLQTYHMSELGKNRQSFIDEQKLLGDKVLMEHFSLPKLFDTDRLDHAIIQFQEQYHKFTTTQQLLSQQLLDHKKQSQQLEQQHNTLTQQITQIQHSLSLQRIVNYDDVMNQVSQLQEQQKSLRNDAIAERYTTFIQNADFQNQEGRDIIDSLSGVLNIYSLSQLIQQCIALGKEYKYRGENHQEKKKTLEDQKQNISTQIVQFQQNLEKSQQVASEQSLFFCDKIEGNCPYVDLINTSIAKKNTEQLQTLQHQLQLLRDQESQIDKQLSDLQDDKNLGMVEHDIKVLSNLLVQLDWKQLDNAMKQWTELEDKMKSLQQQLNTMQQEQQEQLKHKEQLLVLQTELGSTEQQQEQLKQTQQIVQHDYEQAQQSMSTLPSLAQLEQERISLQHFVQQVHRLDDIVKEYKENLLAVKKLKVQEKMLSDLYTIFSKELLLLVIQSNLPKIQDLMNAYLAQSVDYQLSMDIDKKSATTDTLELFVKILDQHGERQVESLSGGQKVILKLVWMIAISFVTNAPMLYLDETINNLDTDTVAKVADMITNFIKTKGPDFQFYVITHSQQIQEMGIWDGVIELRI